MTLKQFKAKILKLAKHPNNLLQDIEEVMFKYFNELPKPAIHYPYPYMIRCSANGTNEIFANVGRCSYNPNPSNIRLQRCNYTKQQVFYAVMPHRSSESTTMTCALLEILLQSIEDQTISELTVTFSRWKVVKPFKIIAFPFSANIAKRNPVLSELSASYELNIRSSHSQNEADLIIDSYKFISDCLSDLNDKDLMYRITAPFYNAVMKICQSENRQIDGLLYPSANTQEAGINLALTKDLVDNASLVAEHVVMYEMTRNTRNGNLTSFDKISNIVSPDGNGNFSF